MQIDPQILREEPNLAAVQQNFQDINSKNSLPSIPSSPITPTPPNEDLLQKRLRQLRGEEPTPSLTRFSTQLSDIPSNDRFPFILPGTNYEELYAQAQSTASKWGNALIKMAGIAGTTFIQGTLGTINGVGQAISDGKFSSFYDNEFNRSLDQFTQENENRFPNYYTEAEINSSIGQRMLTANFWADKVVKNLGYAAGAVGTGAAWIQALKLTRLYSAIAASGKMAEGASALEAGIATVPKIESLQAGKSVLEGISRSVNIRNVILNQGQRITASGLAALSEASIEALQNSQNFKNNLVNDYINEYGQRPQGEDLDKITQQAQGVGNWTFGLNMALLTASNFIQLPKILGSNFAYEKSLYNNGVKEVEDIVFDATKNEFVKQVPRTTIGRFLKGAKNVSSFFFSPTEAFEEGSQTAIGIGTEDYFNKKYRGQQVDFFSALGEGVRQTLTTTDGIESLLIGGVSGGITQLSGNIRERREISRNTRAAIQEFNSSTFNGYMNDSISGFNRSLTLQEQRAQAIKNGERLDANDLENDYLHNYLTPRIKYGRIDLVQEDINNYKTIASNEAAFSQLKDSGILPQDMTAAQFIQKLDEIENYVEGMRNQYTSLNIRYAGVKNEDGSRKYPDEVIDRLVYASSKASFYEKLLPTLTNPLVFSGVNIQPVLDSLETNNRPSTQATEDVINQINNLNVNSDIKEDLRDNLRDSIEVTLRRKKFLKDYESIKKNPSRFKDARFGADDLFDQGSVIIPQQDSEIELEQNQPYSLSDPFIRQGNRITVLPTIEIVGRTTIGEVQIRTPFGQSAILSPEDVGNFSINRQSTPDQRQELERRYSQAIDKILEKEEYKEFEIPQGDIYTRLNAINAFDNQQLADDIEQALNEATEQYQREQEEIEELRKNKEKLKEIDKQFEEEEKESSEVPTNDPTEDNKIIAKENGNLGSSKELRENNQRKPLSILFDSTTSPNYDITTPNDNFHRRANKFLNNIETFPDKEDYQVLLVTRNNQDTLGLMGLIPEFVPGEKNMLSTDTNNGIIQAVFVKGDNFVDVNGEILSAIGQAPDFNKLVYQTLPNTSLQERSGNNRYIDTGRKASSEEEAEEAQEAWQEKRAEIFESESPLRYNFSISRGALNSPKDAVHASPVGSIIKQEMLDRKVIYIPMTGIKQTATVPVGEVEVNGVTYYFPVGRPLLKVGSILQQLNNRKFNQEEKDNLKNLIANLPDERGEINQEILSYLTNVLYVRTPKTNPAKNQMWIEEGQVYFGSRDISVPFTRSALANSPELDNFLNSVNINVNATKLARGNQFREIVGLEENGDPIYVRWKSYQHYLLSPVYDLADSDSSGRSGNRGSTPLYLNLPDPEKSNDPYEAAFQRKYVTLKDFEVFQDESTGSSNMEVFPTNESELEKAILNIADTIENYNKWSNIRDNSDREQFLNQISFYKPLLSIEASKATLKSIDDYLKNIKVFSSNEVREPISKLLFNFITNSTSDLPLEPQYPAVDIVEEEGDVFMQIDEDIPSSANSITLLKLNNFLNSVNVNKQFVEQITLNGRYIPANGLADPSNKLIQVVQGKEDITLPEEAMHIAVELVAQQNPPLFNKMLNRIGSYNLYNKTLEQYRNNPFYQTNGKPDIRKIKKEAIGKVLAETIIKKIEGTTENPERLQQARSWWQQIVDFLKDLFGFKNPFEQTVEMVLNDEIYASEIPSQDAIFLQLDPTQIETIDRLAINPPTREGNSFTLNGQPVEKTTTQLVENVYEKLYRSKSISKEEYDELISYERSFKDDQGHKELNSIFDRLLDDNGMMQENAGRKGETSLSDSTYDTLFENTQERLQTYPKGTRFLPNLNVHDPKSQRAANIDLLAIRPDGTIDIVDFRFLNLPENTEKIPSSIRQGANVAIDSYQTILSNAFGIPINLFGQKRTIPVLIAEENGNIESIQIGTPRGKEKNNLLIPIVATSESTGDPKIDAIISRINGLVEKMQKTRTEQGHEYIKYGELADLISSARNIQLYNSGKKFINTAEKHVKKIEKYFTPYFKILKSGTQEEKNALKLNDLSGQIIDAVAALDLYKDLIQVYQTELGGTPAIEGNVNKAERISGEALRVKGQLTELSNKLRIDVLARGLGIQDFLKPERVIGWYKNWVRSLSQSPTKAGQILWKIVNKMNNKAAIEYDEEFKKLKSLSDEVTNYAKSKGTTTQAQFIKLLNVTNGRWNGQLIEKTDKKFFEELKIALEKGDSSWINSNIDTESYKNWYEQRLKEIEDSLSESRLDADDTMNEEKKEKRIQAFKDQFDIENLTDSSARNWRIKDFALPKWDSESYKVIASEKPLINFYNYIQEKNRMAYDLGMLKSWEFKTFVPNIRKSMLERISFGEENRGNKSKSLNFLNNIRIDVNDQAFGHVDPVTGKNEDSIFAMYTYDLGEKVKGIDNEEFWDYSAKSADLFKIFSLFNQEIIKFKYASEVENTVKLLQFTEEQRQAIKPSKTGGILYRKGTSVPITVPNIENSEYLKSHIDYHFYGKKLSDTGDVTFKLKYNEIARSVNKIVDVLPLSSEEEVTISGKKAIQVANRWFSLKVLGFNLASAGANLMGGSANAYISAGRFFTPSDMRNSQLRFASGKFWTPEGKKYAGLVDYLVSLVDDHVQNTSRSLSVSNAVKWLFSDNIMFLQRSSDKAVQLPVTMAFLDNTMIENGELVNIRDYVKQKLNYANKYNLPAQEQVALDAQIEKEIKALKDTRSLPKVVEIINDEIRIPDGKGGYLERTSQTVLDLRSQIQQYTKDIIGNMSPEDSVRYKMTVLGQSFMMFKNWIPRMADVRFSEFRFNSGTDTYEWGRVRMLVNAVKHNLRRGALDVLAVLGNKNQGVIEIAKQVYQQKRQQIEEEQGIGSFTMAEADFIDAYVRGIRASLKELGMWVGLLGIIIASNILLDDEEDKPVQGAAKGWLRYLDRVSNELSFFYNPLSYIELANGNIFPSIGVVTDVLNITGATGSELWYLFTGDEEGMKDNKVAKYVFKAFPISKEIVSYTALFNDDIAKSLGIRIGTEQRRRD